LDRINILPPHTRLTSFAGRGLGGEVGERGGLVSPGVAVEVDEGALGEVPPPGGDVVRVRLRIGIEAVPHVLGHGHVFLGPDVLADRHVPGQSRVLVEAVARNL
jgi:hypothetical protein